jgi:ATPase subunit of ABC transporter with duplicated ATPase domains
VELLTLRKLTVAVSGQTLISDADLAIGDGDRIGLVGPNGCGKSTLLRAMMGEVEPERGEITRWRGLRPGFLHQTVVDVEQNITVSQFVRRGMPTDLVETNAYMIDLTLDEMGFPQFLHDVPLSQVSGGWQRMAQLAAIWVGDPNLLLLDEPTNFLDIENILRFEAWLGTTVTCPVVVISHDRELLDKFSNRTLVIHNGTLLSISHPFSRAMTIVQDRLIAEQKSKDVQEKEIRRLTFTYKRLKHWGQTFNVEKFSRRAKSIAKRVERLNEDLPRTAAADKRRIVLEASGVSSDYVFRLRNTKIAAADGRTLFSIGRLGLQPGDRTVILGRNGVGKSTFMRFLHRALTDRDVTVNDADVSVSPQVAPAYFDQDLQALPSQQTPLGYLGREFGLNRTTLIASLVRVGIPYEKVEHPIATLSGGQRSRLLLLALQMRDPNLYLLDEPTNHLDIQGMEQLEYELTSGNVTAVIVSHDRRFIAEVGTRFLLIANDRLTEIPDPEPFYESLASAPSAWADSRPKRSGPPTTARPDQEATLAEILRLEGQYPNAEARPEQVRRRLVALYELLARLPG